MKICDIVIIGGGITGSGIARDTALRGLSVTLLEKEDFASGTSSKSGKLIHGGLRYLKYFHLKLVFESCLERIRLFRVVAPHIVFPVRFYFPFYKKSHTPIWLTALGLFLYDLLSLFRNIKNFKFVSKKSFFQKFPNILENDYIGALSYSDCACLDYRLVIDTLKSAQEAGAEIHNYCEVKNIIYEKDIYKIQYYNFKSRSLETVFSKSIVNSTGAWADDLISISNSKQSPFNLKFTCGVHLVFSKLDLPCSDTLTLESPEDFRNIYLVPWGEYVLVGTTDKTYFESKENIPIFELHVEYIFKILNHYFERLKLKRSMVISVLSGIRPLIGSDNNQKEEEISRDYEIRFDKNGMLSITGGKLTTYRLMAEKASNALVQNKFKNRVLKPITTLNAISGGNIKKFSELKNRSNNLKVNINFDLLWRRYGSNVEYILELIQNDSETSKQIPGCKYIVAEIEYILKYEYVYSLSDIMFRRTDLYLFSDDNGLQCSHQIAQILQKNLNWNTTRLNEELSSYKNQVSSLLFLFRNHNN